ncbi:MAG: AAA family ATPase [Spirochaetales bacterium]|nr:AAA family ATPase [Spirochaetales bacterium]
MSHPRRFVKSMAANMIAAYYDESCDSRPLFEDLKIANEPSFEEHLNKYPIVKIDVSGFMTMKRKKVNIANNLELYILKDLKESYPEILTEEDTILALSLLKVFKPTNKQFVFIIDEWDAIFRELPNSDTEQK